MGRAGNRGRTGGASGTTAPRLKLFRPISWYGNAVKPVRRYVEHLLTELGRLEMEIHDIEWHDRPPHTKTVLSDLMCWVIEHPGEAYAKLVDWQTLDLSRLRARLGNDRSAKPRIELSAHITKMNNLSVRWHPRGWGESFFDWDRTDHNHFNLVTHRKWPEPPDFWWFQGDEQPTFNSRPSNELMYLRGVGNLQPEPRDARGPYATFNGDVVDSILICAVRAAYEGLIEQLKRSFDVEVMDGFDFVLRDEIHGDDELSRRIPVHRVVAWSLEGASELEARRGREAAAQQERRDRDELADLPGRHGFTMEMLIDALLQASSKKANGPAPSSEGVNRNAAKFLRDAGCKVDAANVRRTRQLIERYAPEALPPTLRLAPRDPSASVAFQSNVVRIPSGDE